MNIGRRMFASLLPAAPAAAFSGVDQLLKRGSEKLSTGRIDTQNTLFKGFDPSQVTEPENLQKYYSSVQNAHKLMRYRRLLGKSRREVHSFGVPPSIDCLRSVSRVHKHQMMVKQKLNSELEERTFTKKLMDQFGVREWFEKMNPNSDDVEFGYVAGL